MKVRKQREKKRGFTLLEVLLVVAILVALAAIVAPNLINTQAGAMRDQAKLQVNSIESAFKLYQVHNGVFPNSDQGLNSLYQEPSPAPKNWRGPYLDQGALVDPWGNQYNYTYPGQKNSSGVPDVWSNGPDGQSGTQDDIGNWTE